MEGRGGEDPLSSPRLVLNPKIGEQGLGLSTSHLRGLGWPVSHGDGHLILGVAGREDSFVAAPLPRALLASTRRPPSPRALLAGTRRPPGTHSLAGLLAHAEAGLSLDHTHL